MTLLSGYGILITAMAAGYFTFNKGPFKRKYPKLISDTIDHVQASKSYLIN